MSKNINNSSKYNSSISELNKLVNCDIITDDNYKKALSLLKTIKKYEIKNGIIANPTRRQNIKNMLNNYANKKANSKEIIKNINKSQEDLNNMNINNDKSSM